uniref:Cilia- and flagella-associated protein 36 n=1 Tax=Timema poppense TaxID=170557 RepID=A0A7R9CXD2_TIMPO|nr:unnamed protein product [Timema poppensis]
MEDSRLLTVAPIYTRSVVSEGPPVRVETSQVNEPACPTSMPVCREKKLRQSSSQKPISFLGDGCPGFREQAFARSRRGDDGEAMYELITTHLATLSARDNCRLRAENQTSPARDRRHAQCQPNDHEKKRDARTSERAPKVQEGVRDQPKECAITVSQQEYEVDSMLGSYMEDIGITPEQFESACSKTVPGGMQIRFHQSLFEQVWAANDYEIFKHMMIQRNLELQLQALEMIQQRCGITPQVLLPNDGPESLHTVEETQVMEEAIKLVVISILYWIDINTPIAKDQSVTIRKSLEEYQACKEMLDSSTIELEQSLATSTDEHDRLEAECKREKVLLQTAMQHTIEPTASAPPESPQPKEELLLLAHAEVSPTELARRQAYLKSQRDKLLSLKKHEREKQLKAAEARPQSARVAQSALAGRESGTTVNATNTMQLRRALAERLKSEVVGHL